MSRPAVVPLLEFHGDRGSAIKKSPDATKGGSDEEVETGRTYLGTNLALLEPDVAAAFPTDGAVNDALRTLLQAAKAVKVAAALTRRTGRKQAVA